jgi:hypothetical protein
VKLYFELGGYDPYQRGFWEEHLARWTAHAPPDVRVVSDPADADAVIETTNPVSLLDPWPFRIGRTAFFRSRPESTFVWDASDFPGNRLPGLYSSASRWLHTPGRHRPFCYPLSWNEHIRQAPASEAAVAFGFIGAVTAPVRARLFSLFAGRLPAEEALIQTSAPMWDRMLSPKSRGEKEGYADAIARCRFFLCPKGNGVGSVRLFEVMQAGRVPVVISDRLLLPSGIDWKACSLRVRERDIGRLPEIIRQHEPEWERMAANARAAWEENFSEENLLRSVARELKAILAARSIPERYGWALSTPRLVPFFLETRAKQVVRRTRGLLRRKRTS